MIETIAISAGLQLLAAIIDALRIRSRWGAAGNIHHAVSAAVGVTLAGGQWFGQRPDWRWWAFGILSVAMRLALYDILLNLLRRERPDYISIHTSALTGAWWRRLRVPFWWQRAIGAGGVLIILIIQNIL